MKKNNWLNDHKLFYSELLNGVKFQKIIEENILKLDIEVHTPDFYYKFDLGKNETQYEEWMKSRANIEKTREEYGQKEEDILIGKNKILCECKSRDIYFTDVSSFPYLDIFIDTVKGYENKKIKPSYTFCISQKTKSIIYLDSSPQNKNQWIKRVIFDKKRGIEELNYCAPKKLWRNFSTFKQEFFINYGE